MRTLWVLTAHTQQRERESKQHSELPAIVKKMQRCTEHTDSLTCLSSFLQTPTWPYCQKCTRKCLPPNVIHCPDVAIMFEEPPQNPPGDHTPFRVPILPVEIEGDRGTWGKGNGKVKPLRKPV